MSIQSRTSKLVLCLILAAIVWPLVALAQAVYPGMKSGVVKIIADKPDLGRDTGAGLVVGLDGNLALILTANHVVDEASSIEVKFFDKPYLSFAATPFEKFRQDLDVAILIVAPEAGRYVPGNLPTFKVGDAAGLSELDKISAIGHPLDVEWQISISTIARLEHEDDLRKLRFARSDVAPGNSGGPIFDDGGNVIGMVIEAGPLHGIGVKIDAILPLLQSWRISTSQLIPRTALGALLVSTDPGGAEVHLDSEPVGSTAGGTLTLKDLEPGPHTLRATLSGHADWEQEVEVGADQERAITARLQPQAAALAVRSRPAGADVFLDSRPVGSTAGGSLVLADLKPRRYSLRLEMAGYVDWTERVEVKAGSERVVEATLEPASGSLQVETRPSGAAITLAGRAVGTTTSGALTLGDLAAGRYALAAALEGFETWNLEVEIRPGQDRHILAELRSLPEPPIEAYLVLYKEPTFSGPSLKVRLDDGGRVDIRSGHALFDAASSCELFAPPNVEVMLVEHTLGYDKYPGATRRWRGNGDRLRIERRELVQAGLKNDVSSISWFVDGKLPDRRTAVVP